MGNEMLPKRGGVVVNGDFSFSVPASVIEGIALRAAELVLEQFEARSAAPEYLTVGEAAERLRAKPQRVYDLLSAGRLHRLKDGARVLVSRAEVDAYLANGRAPVLPPAPRSRTSKGDSN